LRKDNELSLTFDAQPALEVDDVLKEKAEQIFGKEQEYLIEAARRAPKQKPQLYVNDNGYAHLRNPPTDLLMSSSVSLLKPDQTCPAQSSTALLHHSSLICLGSSRIKA
jgi:hypothetical protein